MNVTARSKKSRSIMIVVGAVATMVVVAGVVQATGVFAAIAAPDATVGTNSSHPGDASVYDEISVRSNASAGSPDRPGPKLTRRPLPSPPITPIPISPSDRQCPPFPAVPDASCTGVPPGTTLTQHDGDLYVTTDGAVVDAMEVNGCIFVQANNVTIKRTRVNGWCWTGAISAGYGEHTGTLIEDVEVNGTAPGDTNIAGVALIGVDNYTARRVNVHHGGRGFNIGSNVTIEDSYIHQMYGAGDSHNSGIGSNSGVNITIRHNNINCDIGQPGNISTGGGCSGALVLYADTFGEQIGTIDNLTIEENRFNAGRGSYCLLIYNPRTDGTYAVRNNQFGTSFYPDCGQYGPADIIKTQGATLIWQNNTWYAPGETKHGHEVTPGDDGHQRVR